MTAATTENGQKCATRNGKAKSNKRQIVSRVALLVRKAGLSYEDWRYVSRRVRQVCELRPPRNRNGCPASSPPKNSASSTPSWTGPRTFNTP